MSTSKKCKDAGLAGVNELCVITGMSRSTIYDWAKNKPAALECLILGAAVKKERQK